MLTAVVFLPLAGAIGIIALLGNDNPRGVKWFAAGIGIAEFILSIIVFAQYDHTAAGFQLTQQFDWVPLMDIQYHLAIDGLSAPLILLTGLLGLAAIYSSWSVATRHKEYFAWLLVLQTAVMGVFVAQDFIFFFI